MANPASIKGKGFDANPKNINRKGRPKKGIALINAQLAKEGYTPATKADIEANYMSMLQLGQDRLTTLANDKNQPMLISIIAKNMLGGKGFDIVEKMLDRGIGKAKTTEESTVKVEMGKLSKEEQEKIDILLGANFDLKT